MVEYVSEKIYMTEPLFDDLLWCIAKVDDTRAYEEFLTSVLTPYILKQFIQTENGAIREYIMRRYSQLYSLNHRSHRGKSLEDLYCEYAQVDLADLMEWDVCSEDEYEFILKESKIAISGENPEDYADLSRSTELLRYNYSVALTSPYAYIRSLAESIVKHEEPIPWL